MTEFKIEKGVPIPTGVRRGSGITAVLRVLRDGQIGDSVHLPITVRLFGGYTQRIGAGWYRARREGDGCRVWKIGDPQ